MNDINSAVRVNIAAMHDDELLRLDQVLALFPVSRTTWLRGCNEGRYPKGSHISARVRVWRVADIRALLAAQRDAH